MFLMFGLIVTSLNPWSDSWRISSSIEEMGRLRSLPLVKGTMQNEHMLLQPLIIDLHIVL